MKFFSIPPVFRDGELQYSQCEMYDLNYLNISEYRGIQEIKEILPSDKIITKCKNGWVYDKSLYINTVITEVMITH